MAAVALGYVNPAHRTGPIRFGLQFPLQRLQPAFAIFRIRHHRLNGLAVNSGCSAVADDQSERVLQQIAPCQLTIEAPKPVTRFGLGFAIERTLELPKLLGSYYLWRAISRSFAPLLRVRTSSVPSVRLEIGSGLWVECPQIEPAHIVLIMNASDFRADRCRLAGRASLYGRLSVGRAFTHRFGPPRLSDACLPDVLTTLTPAEFARDGDCLSCKRRPSHRTPGARRLCSCNITRLISCGSSSFRPVGSVPGTAFPSTLTGWTGIRLFRREPPNSTGGTCTHELRTLRGLLRGGLFIANERPQIILFVFRRRGFCNDNDHLEY